MEKLNLKQIQKVESYILRNVVDICETNSIPYVMYAGSLLGTVRHGGSIPWDSDVDIIIAQQELEHFKAACKATLKWPLYFDTYPENPDNKQLVPRVGCKGIDIACVHVDVFFYTVLPVGQDEQEKVLQEAKVLRDKFKIKRLLWSKNKSAFKRVLSNANKLRKSLMLRESKQQVFDAFMELCTRIPENPSDKVIELSCTRHWEREAFSTTYYEHTVQRQYDGFNVRIPEDYDSYLKQLYGDYMKLPPMEEQLKTRNMTTPVEHSTWVWCGGNNLL